MKLGRARCLRTGEIIQGEVVAGGSIKTEEKIYEPSELKLLPPVEAGKVICVGLNYRDHVEETGAELPRRPSLFFKPRSAIVGPGEPVIIEPEYRYDPEGEVAVVIGAETREVGREEAFNYIAGFTGLNDVTNRDAQSWEENWVRAKGFDTAAPLGPYLVPPAEIDPPISFQLKVNDEVRQSADTSQLIFSVPDLVAEISSFMTLKPGDVISTGTPKGVAPIKGGDTVRLKLEGIGTLENPVSYRDDLPG